MENIKLAYSEVYAIINLMSYNLRSKIPSNFIKLILMAIMKLMYM